MRFLKKSIYIFVISMCFAAPQLAWAEEQSAQPKDIWERETLTGDWNGVRTELDDRGLGLAATETAELFGNATGGIRTGAVADGMMEVDLNADFEKLAGLHGLTGKANTFLIQGQGLSQENLDNIFTVSNVADLEAARLYELWLQQSFLNDKASFRIGQIAADQEFITTQYGSVFINSTFGWPGAYAADFPGGGPAYPIAAPGARLKLGEKEPLSFQIAVFSGNPAGPGTGNPQNLNPSGTDFPFNTGALTMAELDYALNGKNASGLPGTYKIGFWYNSNSFDDLRLDNEGRSLAEPDSDRDTKLHNGNYGVYGVIDQLLWRKPETRDSGIGGFVRAMAQPADRNLVSWYVDTGLSFKGLVPSRGGDVFGIGFAYANISSNARKFDEDASRFSGRSIPLRDFESLIEVTYQSAVTPWLSIQPDFQYIINPGGNIANPNIPSGTIPIKNAVIFGIRTAIKF